VLHLVRLTASAFGGAALRERWIRGIGAAADGDGGLGVEREKRKDRYAQRQKTKDRYAQRQKTKDSFHNLTITVLTELAGMSIVAV
jgi:hypothetical protein